MAYCEMPLIYDNITYDDINVIFHNSACILGIYFDVKPINQLCVNCHVFRNSKTLNIEGTSTFYRL